MDHDHLINLLNRLFQAHCRSLPVYLQTTRPWTPPGQQGSLGLLAAVAVDHQQTAERIAEAIQQEHGRLDPGRFPTTFAAVNDLSADFLLRRAAELHRRDLETIGQCAAELATIPHLQSLGEHALRQARRHQAMLGEGKRGEGRGARE